METDTLSRNGLLTALGVVVTATVIGVIFAHENGVQIIGFGSFICVSLLTLLQQISAAERAAAKVEEVKQATMMAARRVEAATVRVAEKVEEAKEATVKVAEKVEEAKDAAISQVDKLDAIAATTVKVHALVNSAMGVQLRLHAATSRRLANITGSIEDAKVAVLAESVADEHEVKQQGIDAKEVK